MESRVELFARIRRDARVEGLSIRELARRHGVGRPTVRQALAQAELPARKPRVRTAPRLEAFKAAIDEMLRQDLDAPRKQRHTARRVFARLSEEHDATELSYSTVRDYVRRRRPEIDVEAGRLPEVFIPQEHAAGAEEEVDFGEVWVVLAGVNGLVDEDRVPKIPLPRLRALIAGTPRPRPAQPVFRIEALDG